MVKIASQRFLPENVRVTRLQSISISTLKRLPVSGRYLGILGSCNHPSHKIIRHPKKLRKVSPIRSSDLETRSHDTLGKTPKQFRRVKSKCRYARSQNLKTRRHHKRLNLYRSQSLFIPRYRRTVLQIKTYQR